MTSNGYVQGDVQDVHLYLLKSENNDDAKLEVKLNANTHSYFHGARVHATGLKSSSNSNSNTMCALSCHGDKQNTHIKSTSQSGA